MKKLISIIAALAIGASAFAIDLGVIGGFSFNSLTGTTTSGNTTTTTKYDMAYGGKVGAAIDIPVAKILSVQPEILFHFNNGGSSSSEISAFGLKASGTTVYSFNSIEFPVLAKANLNIGSGTLSALVGPTFNILIGEITTTVTSKNNIINNTSKTESKNTSFDDANWNTFVVGLEAGAEYSFKAGPGKLAIGCVVDFDFGDIAKSDNVTLTRFAITPQLTYYFGL